VGSEHGWSVSRVRLDARTLEYDGSFRIAGGPVAPASYPAFRAFLDAMRRQDDREIVLSP
jgi:hypothetical protein